MSQKIAVVKYKQGQENFPSGCNTTVSSEARVLGVEKNVLLEDVPLESCKGDQRLRKDLLVIDDPIHGVLYIDDTELTFAAKIAVAGGGSGGSNTLSGTYTVGTAGVVKSGNDVTIAALAGKQILFVQADDLGIEYTLEVVDDEFTGKITFPNGIGATAKLFILYNN